MYLFLLFLSTLLFCIHYICTMQSTFTPSLLLTFTPFYLIPGENTLQLLGSANASEKVKQKFYWGVGHAKRMGKAPDYYNTTLIPFLIISLISRFAFFEYLLYKIRHNFSTILFSIFWKRTRKRLSFSNFPKIELKKTVKKCFLP